MRVPPFLLIAPLILGGAVATLGADYIVEIDGARHEINVGEERKIALPDGSEATIRLLRKPDEGGRVESALFSVEPPGNLKPIQTEIGNGVLQTVFSTESKTTLIAQEHPNTIPKELVNQVLEELLAQDIQSGFDVERSEIEREAGGYTFKGLQAVTLGVGEEWKREVLSVSEGDRGLLVVTMNDRLNASEESALVDSFWKNLEVHFGAP